MLKLFISYSHFDQTSIEEFIKHLAPLKNSGIIVNWHDRKIDPGIEFQKEIDFNLTESDIICLMISHSFLASVACLKEKNDALTLKHSRGIKVIPIILSPCSWNLHPELASLLLVPTDGKPITAYADYNEGWFDSIQWITRASESIIQIKELKNTLEFKSFLTSADILTKSHNSRESLELKDIFVYPKLKSYDGEEKSHKYNSENLANDLLNFNKLIIAGENQSGKTTLCKIIFQIYRSLNYVPIYLDDENKYLGKPENKIEKAFSEQYIGKKFNDIPTRKIVPIIDNFHSAKHQDKYIEQYFQYPKQVLIVDDIFGLNIKNQNLIKEYKKFKIREFSPLERNELIRKWVEIKEEAKIQLNRNHLQQSIDEKTELIENSLGVIFGKGIMPSFPFFILSLLAAQDIQKPLDSEITSQGHCYQALIYLYLRKQGVKNDQIDIYINFLSEIAYFIYQSNSHGIDNESLQLFITEYKAKFNLPISIAELLGNLAAVNICKVDSLNQFNFCYSYIYYFFVAKYLAEHLDSKKESINRIISNLHKDENAYITVFIAHHTKSNYLLDELSLNAEILFEKHLPATLDTDELTFFDKHEDEIVKALLPNYGHNSTEERKKILIEKSRKEEASQEEFKQTGDSADDSSYELLNNLRLSIKTVEVMGLVIKNRAGSLDKQRLEYLYEQGMKVHLRIISSFIELIPEENTEQEVINFLKERINKTIEEKEEENKRLSIEKIEQLVRKLYWNLNFGVLHGFITKAIHSLGSSNLLNISQSVSEKLKTPSAFIINHGIRMWYAKNLRIEEIASRLKERDFSLTAKQLMKLKIVEHCKLHDIDFKDLKKIETKLDIPTTTLISERAKNK